jgi:PKHD-type hydroxylase
MLYKALWNQPRERTQITFPYVWWDGMFSDEEINKLAAYCQEVGQLIPGGLSMGRVDETIRKSPVCHHLWCEDNAWVFDRFNDAISRINTRWYGFDLNGYDVFQYAEYHAEEGGHYDWHMDINMGIDRTPPEMIEPRKLSIAMLLNTPGEDFEGGEFQINGWREEKPINIDIRKGRIIAFPSFMIHRVCPVTKGVRKSLVIWVSGPKFV